MLAEKLFNSSYLQNVINFEDEIYAHTSLFYNNLILHAKIPNELHNLITILEQFAILYHIHLYIVFF